MEDSRLQSVHSVETGRNASARPVVDNTATLDKETGVSMIGLCLMEYNEAPFVVAMWRKPLRDLHQTSPVATTKGVSSFKSCIYEQSGRKGSP